MRALKRGAHVLGRVQCSLAASEAGRLGGRRTSADDGIGHGCEAALHLLQQVLHLRHNIRQVTLLVVMRDMARGAHERAHKYGEILRALWLWRVAEAFGSFLRARAGAFTRGAAPLIPCRDSKG